MTKILVDSDDEGNVATGITKVPMAADDIPLYTHPAPSVLDGWQPSDDELTNIYNTANGLDPKRHNPITTERIFTAMRAMLSAAAMAERNACKEIASEYGMKSGIGDDGIAAADAIESAIAMRSNASLSGLPLGKG